MLVGDILFKFEFSTVCRANFRRVSVMVKNRGGEMERKKDRERERETEDIKRGHKERT